MQIKRFTFWTALLLSAVMLWGCGSSGSGGSDVASTPDMADVETLGISNCAQCHAQINEEWLESGHGNANSSPTGPHEGDSYCGRCHNNLEDGFLMPSAYGEFVRDVVGCESCHGGGSAHRGLGPLPIPEPGLEQCAQCHSDLSVYGGHAYREPYSDQIAQRFEEGRHTGRARTGTCAACHSHEGAKLLLRGDKIDTVGELVDAIGDELAALEDTTVKTCATCHEGHTFDLRGVGDVVEAVADDATSTGPAERLVFSAEYNLCTSCHQVNLDYEFVEDAGYSEGGMFEYNLSDAYLHANDPYGDNSDVGYHSDSYQDRSFFETHFAGSISKDLYYYDIKDGVEKASSDRFGDPIPEVVEDPDAMAFLEEYYQEYLNAPDDIVVTGYNVNPGSADACSVCHDVHAANKIVGTADLVKEAGHELNAEDRIQQAISFGQGIGKTHGNYINDAFSRDTDYSSCTPCHTGQQFVHLTKGAEELEGERWNALGCVTCHDLVEVGDVVVTEPRSFDEDHVFEFASGAEMPMDNLEKSYIDRFDNPVFHDNKVCFECHKGRSGYKGDATADVVYDVNYLHYSPSFAIMMGTESEMLPPGYEGKTYAEGLTLPLAYGAHSSYDNCLGCHDIHSEYDQEGFEPTNLQTNLCGSCHYVTVITEDKYWRSFNVLRKRTEVFADVLKSTITDALTDLVGSDNDAAIIVQGIDGDNVTLTADEEVDYIDVFGGESYATGTTDADIAKRLKTYLTGSPRDITGSRLVNSDLAKAGAIWKNFNYDDKGGWAHNSILARQMMYDATVAIGGPAALDKFCDHITDPAEGVIGVQIDTAASGDHENGYGGLIRNLDEGGTARPISCE